MSHSIVEVTAGTAPPRRPKIADAALLTISRVARLGLRVVFMLVVARALGPREFGVYVLLLAVLEMAGVAGGSCFTDYLTRETAKDERSGWRAAIQLAFLRAGYAVPLAGLALGALWLLGYHGTVLAAAAVMFATLIPRSVSESVQGVLRGVCRYWAFLAIDVTVGFALVGGGCWLLFTGGGLQFVARVELAAASAAGLLSLAMLAVMGKAKRDWLGWRDLIRKTLVFNYYPLATSFYDRIDIILLSKIAGDFATGIYGMAYRVLNALQLIPYGVLFSILPSISRDSWGPSERQRLERAMGLLLSISYAAVLATTAFAGPAVGWVLGPRYAGSVLALEILIWAVIPRSLNAALNMGLLATSRERIFTYTSSACLVVNLAVNLILIPLYSWRGAAAATIITELFLLVQYVYWIRKTVGSVPVPSHSVRTTVAFLGLLAALLVAGRYASPALVGAICLVLFLGYLYQVQSLGQFRATWATGRGSAT